MAGILVLFDGHPSMASTAAAHLRLPGGCARASDDIPVPSPTGATIAWAWGPDRGCDEPSRREPPWSVRSDCRHSAIGRTASESRKAPDPLAVTSPTERREPNAQVADGEAVQVPGAATRDLLGLGSQKPGELPLEPQPRVLPDDALADRIGYLVAAEPEHIDGCAGG